MKCNKCKYFTGVHCHGHGDFWGECRLYNEITDFIVNRNKALFMTHKDIPFLYSDSECYFEKLLVDKLYKK